MKGIHHIGIAVKKFEDFIPFYVKQGWKFHSSGYCKAYDTYCMFFKKEGDLIELCKGGSPSSPISKYLVKHKEGLHHIAFNRKFKDGVEGAIPNMKVRFLDLKKTNNILTEEVSFDGL